MAIFVLQIGTFFLLALICALLGAILIFHDPASFASVPPPPPSPDPWRVIRSLTDQARQQIAAAEARADFFERRYINEITRMKAVPTTKQSEFLTAESLRNIRLAATDAIEKGAKNSGC